MKYFATIAGNDYTKFIMKKSFDFHKIANFCRSLHSGYSSVFVHQTIANFMEIDQSQFDAIATSIRSYSIHFFVNPIDSPMVEYCSSNVLLFAFYTENVFQYEANFLDFKQRNNNNRNNNAHTTIFDTLIEVLRKLGGILLKGQAHRKPVLKIVTKYSFQEKYTLKEHTPIYPSGKHIQNICT